MKAVFVRDHCLGNDCDRFSIAQGHIHRMDNGNWLISWGRGDDRGGSVLPLEASLTEFDPLTNEELLAFKITHPEYHNSEQVQPTRAYPVKFVALADTPGPLRAEIVESPASSAFHLGPTDAPKVVVAFSRPVVDPDPAATTWPSVSVTGATIAGISPHMAPGDPANAYLVTLTPTGVGPITFALVPGQSCASGGICTAGGTVLTEVPASSHVIPARSTGPPVMSITSSGTHPTKDGFTVTITFSEPVTGLTANEIEVTKGAGSNFAGAGAVYTLDIAPDAGIEDDVTVTAGAVVGPLNNGNLAASAAFAVDTQAPVVSRVAITSNPGPDATYAPGDEMEVTVTFSETVVVTGTPQLSLELGGGSRTATYGGGSGTAALVFVYEVAGGESDSDGVSIEADSLSLNGGAIQDGVNNDAVLDHETLAADSSHQVDGVKPELAVTDGAVVDGTTLTLTYNETLDGSSTPELDDFTVAGGDRTRVVSGVLVRGATVELTLDSGAEHEEAGITVSYTPGMNRLRDVAGNEAEALSQEPVTNDTPDTTSPTVSSVEITSNPPDNRDTYAIGDVIEATVTFSETVMVTGTPRVTLKVGERDRSANYESVTGAVVVFAYTVAVNDSDTDGVSIEADSLSGGTIRDTARNNAVLTHSAVAADTGQQVDGIKPSLASTDGAVANGTTLTLAYGEPLDSSSVPAMDDFTLTGGSETRTVTGVRVSGSTVFLTLNSAVTDGESGLRVNYEPGSNPIQDTAGNDADRLSNKSVTNETGDTKGPTVSNVAITSSAGSDRTYGVDEIIEVTVTFNETVVITGTPELTLNVGGGNRTAEYRSVSNRAVKFAYRVVTGDNDEDGVSIEANRSVAKRRDDPGRRRQ